MLTFLWVTCVFGMFQRQAADVDFDSDEEGAHDGYLERMKAEGKERQDGSESSAGLTSRYQ